MSHARQLRVLCLSLALVAVLAIALTAAGFAAAGRAGAGLAADPGRAFTVGLATAFARAFTAAVWWRGAGAAVRFTATFALVLVATFGRARLVATFFAARVAGFAGARLVAALAAGLLAAGAAALPLLVFRVFATLYISFRVGGAALIAIHRPRRPAMIVHSRADRQCSEKLLVDHQPGDFMGQRERSERPAPARRAQHFGAQPEVRAERENQGVGPLLAQLLQRTREALRRPRFAVAVEGDQQMRLRQRRQ